MAISLVASLALILPPGLAGWWMAWKHYRAATDTEKAGSKSFVWPTRILPTMRPLESNPQLADDILRGLQKAVVQQPTNTSLWRSKAVVLHRTGGLDEALADFSQAIELATLDADGGMLNDTLRRRSKLRRELNRWGEAGLDERRASEFALRTPFAGCVAGLRTRLASERGVGGGRTRTRFVCGGPG